MRAPFTLLAAGSADSPANAAKLLTRPRRSSPRKQQQSPSKQLLIPAHDVQPTSSPVKRKPFEANSSPAKAPRFPQSQENDADNAANVTSTMTSSTAFILDDMSSEDEKETCEGEVQEDSDNLVTVDEDVKQKLQEPSTAASSTAFAAIASEEPKSHVIARPVNNEETAEKKGMQGMIKQEDALPENQDEVADANVAPPAEICAEEAASALPAELPEESSFMTLDQLPPLPESPLKSIEVEGAFQASTSASPCPSISCLPEDIPLPESPVKHRQIEENFQSNALVSPTSSHAVRPENILLPASPYSEQSDSGSNNDMQSVPNEDVRGESLLKSPMKNDSGEQAFQPSSSASPSEDIMEYVRASAAPEEAPVVEASDIPADPSSDSAVLARALAEAINAAEVEDRARESQFGSAVLAQGESYSDIVSASLVDSEEAIVAEVQQEVLGETEVIGQDAGMDSMDLDNSSPSVSSEDALENGISDPAEHSVNIRQTPEDEEASLPQQESFAEHSLSIEAEPMQPSAEEENPSGASSLSEEKKEEITVTEGASTLEPEPCQALSMTHAGLPSSSDAAHEESTDLPPFENPAAEASQLEYSATVNHVSLDSSSDFTLEAAQPPALNIDEVASETAKGEVSQVDTAEVNDSSEASESSREESSSSLQETSAEMDRSEESTQDVADSNALSPEGVVGTLQVAAEHTSQRQTGDAVASPAAAAGAEHSAQVEAVPEMKVEEPSEVSVEIGRAEAGPSLSAPGTPVIELQNLLDVTEDLTHDNPAGPAIEESSQTPATIAALVDISTHLSPVASRTAQIDVSDAPTTKRRTLSRGTSKSRKVQQAPNANLEEPAMLGVEAAPVRRSARRSLSPSLSMENLAAAAATAGGEDSRTEVATKDKRKGRKRSLSVMAKLEDTDVEGKGSPEPVLVLRSRTPTTSIAPPGLVPVQRSHIPVVAAPAVEQEEQNEVERPHTPATAHNQPVPAKRQSRRIAAVSSLPQLRASALPKAKKNESTAAKKQKLSEEQPPAAKKGKGKAKEEEEDDSVFEIVQTQAKASSAHATSRTSALPQRSSRPTRSRTVGNVSRSPGRVLSPQKKTVGRTVESAICSPKSGKTLLHRSPQRVPLPGKASSSSNTAPKSPVRTGDWKWPSTTQPQQPKTNIRGPYSPEGARRAAKNVFGSSASTSSVARPAACFPAFPAASTSSASQPSSSQASVTATVSPIKGLAQHLRGSTSPGLLGLSLAPESLVLAAPPPRPEAPMSPCRAPIAGSSAPLRDMSLPPTVSAAAAAARATFGSPRRAHSAQPPASPSKTGLSSPRRVPLVGGVLPPPPFALPRAAPGPGEAQEDSKKPPLSPRRVPIAAPVGSQPIKGSAGAALSETISLPSKTGIAKPVQRAVRASSRRVVSAPTGTQPIASTSQLAAPLPPALSAAQLSALTNKNTSFNRKHYNVHNVTVIHKDENRPPSPTSKIRKIIEESVEVASSSSSSKKQDRQALQQTSSASQAIASEEAALHAASVKRPHFMAAGDEGLYESPAKASTSVGDDERQSKKARTLKWDRELLKQSTEARTPRRAKAKAAELLQSKRPYKKIPQPLDAFGNLLDSKASLSPIVPRTRVPITKVIYKDDPQA